MGTGMDRGAQFGDMTQQSAHRALSQCEGPSDLGGDQIETWRGRPGAGHAGD